MVESVKLNNVPGMPPFVIMLTSNMPSEYKIWHDECEKKFAEYLINKEIEKGCSKKEFYNNIETFESLFHITDSWRFSRWEGYRQTHFNNPEEFRTSVVKYLKDSSKFKKSDYWSVWDDPFNNFKMGFCLGHNSFKEGKTLFYKNINCYLHEDELLLNVISQEPRVVNQGTLFGRYLLDNVDNLELMNHLFEE